MRIDDRGNKIGNRRPAKNAVHYVWSVNMEAHGHGKLSGIRVAYFAWKSDKIA